MKAILKGGFILALLVLDLNRSMQAQTMDEMWDSRSSGKEHPNIGWFKDAKFGLFIHWGLYSKLAGEWKDKNYYGSGEWIMNQAKIPVKEYREVAATFNPVAFNAEDWAQLAKDAGIRYMVVTAKHHEGFSMFDSKVTDFDIVDATPYKKDPMKALAAASRKKGIQFGFYYSQFQDWNEPNGGKNSWDFDEKKKNYQLYYDQKAIPQLKELMTNYGPLGIIWFDTPGGMTRQQTEEFVNGLRRLQPNCLFSSRVGQGLGDYRDFGDSELPTTPIMGPWESIYTHNDSWGYIKHDMNFKSPLEIIRLLANVASKGGNLMLNVGPDGNGRIPEYSEKYLKETGKWLARNGESIYGTTYGLIPQQPWGVSTSKPGKQYLHVFNRPHNGKLIIPGFEAAVRSAYTLQGRKVVPVKKKGNQLILDLPAFDQTAANTVFVIEYTGKIAPYDLTTPVPVSNQFAMNSVDAVYGKVQGSAEIKPLTYSHYYGDWKHATCVTGMKDPTDAASFTINIQDPGDYHIILEYACPQESAKQEGVLLVNDTRFLFRTLRSSEFDKSAPLMFIKHTIATSSFAKAGTYTLECRPLNKGKELFKLKTIVLEPVNAN
ncbi:alpha-L-fucosidase [Desertivirga arenae]|uniref:alpha-L-fucosidase n=1 Tax=Desertivirga arenae TaxID=2810309 RepID=UPI001A96291F|nr:alpha-L-fucosidase [Pedobacter sp. SYSU D00823]